MLWAQFTKVGARFPGRAEASPLWPQKDPSQDGARSDQYCAFPRLSCSVDCRINAGVK